MEMVSLIEDNLGKVAAIIHKPFHKTDIKATWANIREAKKVLGWKPKVSLEEGIRRTVKWYLDNKHWLKNVKI
jgi:nucleoside-diphosphate-sugar epimerase